MQLVNCTNIIGFVLIASIPLQSLFIYLFGVDSYYRKINNTLYNVCGPVSMKIKDYKVQNVMTYLVLEN